MALVFSYYDVVQDLQTLITNRLDSEILGLYQGTRVPLPTDIASVYLAIEATFGGYDRIPLTWSAAVLNSANVAITSSQGCVWKCTASVNLPQTIGGVFALDSSGALAWAEQLPGGPVTIAAVGQGVTYMATLTQGACPP